MTILVDMSEDAENVVRTCHYKTKAGDALQERDELIANGKKAIVVYEDVLGWRAIEIQGN